MWYQLSTRSLISNEAKSSETWKIHYSNVNRTVCNGTTATPYLPRAGIVNPLRRVKCEAS